MYIDRSESGPLYLLADSQLLFWYDAGNSCLHSIQQQLRADELERTRAAYIGASNNDEPVFYQMFLSAMDRIDTHKSRMIPASPSGEDRDFIAHADLILLAGGDPVRGWEILSDNGVADTIREKHHDGAVIVGVSAGAVQLGKGTLSETGEFIPTFGFLPCFIGAHEEDTSWRELRQVVKNGGMIDRGFGLPSGGGMMVDRDGSIEALRYPVNEFTRIEEDIGSTLLFPPENNARVAVVPTGHTRHEH